LTIKEELECCELVLDNF